MLVRATVAALLSLALSAVSIVGLVPRGVRAEANRPDIIAIMVDDLGFLPNNDVLERMPVLNKTFVQGGLWLRRMHGETPLCSPGRASLLTGQHTLRHGVTANNVGVMNPHRSIAFALKRSGYHTTLVGKYFVRWNGGKPDGWSKAAIFSDPGKLAAESASAIRNAPASEPLFAWISATAPHRCDPNLHPGCDPWGPLVPEGLRDAPECRTIKPFRPPSYRTWPTPRPYPKNGPFYPDGWPLKPICESMLQVDEAMAAIKAAQAERGRPAYYFFFSDNGMSWGQKGYPRKRAPTSTRIPMFVAGPGVPKGVSTGKLLSTIDVAPTMAKLGGAYMPWVDGQHFVKLLTGQKYAARKRMLEHSLTPNLKWQAIRYKNWRYIKWPDGRRQLYHLARDPYEQQNKVWSKPALARRLDAELRELVDKSRK